MEYLNQSILVFLLLSFEQMHHLVLLQRLHIFFDLMHLHYAASAAEDYLHTESQPDFQNIDKYSVSSKHRSYQYEYVHLQKLSGIQYHHWIYQSPHHICHLTYYALPSLSVLIHLDVLLQQKHSQYFHLYRKYHLQIA